MTGHDVASYFRRRREGWRITAGVGNIIDQLHRNIQKHRQREFCAHALPVLSCAVFIGNFRPCCGSMKVGVIGAGRIGSVHARNLASMLPAGSLLIHDANPVTAHKVAAEVTGSIRPTAAALVEDADAVVVATPAAERSGILMAAMAKRASGSRIL